MDEKEKMAIRIKEKIPWITRPAYYGQETDGILYQGYDPELKEYCWIKVMFGNRLYLSYDLYHDDWIRIAKL
ncbi:hypothetical protein CULT_1680002 [[Clostridium] ultunense Esp]|uniref:hypothetical protein n=1 Tax=Thermicanus aegyptius TaxID=94009 RepID=UPI0002B70DED|nr:hypothetical protein [Thermicanus aegyptius]CCQ94101.1 hypothetical protein CULT_1680002 [[Clostridium] ultunense Esp]